jgi:hypothetical protein
MKLRDIETKLYVSGVSVAIEQPARQLNEILGVRERVQAGVTDLTGEREKLYKSMLSSRRKKVGWKVARGAIIGATIGAGAGALGEWAGEHINSYFGWDHAAGGDGKTAEKVAQMTQEQLVEAKKRAMEKVLKQGLGKIPGQVFKIHAQAGEGLTNVARDFIHDYLAQQHQLLQDQGVHWTREQLVYAEDFLRRHLEDHIQPGDIYQVKGAAIQDALEKAKLLGSGQSANLKEKWVGKIVEKTWQKMLDYSHSINPENNFAETVHEEALHAVKNLDHVPAPAATVVKEGVRKALEGAVHEISVNAKSEAATRSIIYGILGVGVGTGAVLERKYGKSISSWYSSARDRLKTVLQEKKTEETIAKEELKAEPKTKDQVDELEGQLREENLIVIELNPASDSDPDSDYESLSKLKSALAKLPPDQYQLQGHSFRLGAENGVREDGTIVVDRGQSEKDLVKYLENGLLEAAETREIDLKARHLVNEFEKKGIEVKSTLHGHKLFQGLQSFEESLGDLSEEIKKQLGDKELWFIEPGEIVPEGTLAIQFNAKPMEMHELVEKYLSEHK